MGVFTLLAIALALPICLLVIGIGAAYAYYQSAGRILPGVSAGPVRLDGMTVNEASITLQKTWGLETRIEVTDGLYSQALQPAELGLQIDSLNTAWKAYDFGHIGTPLARLAQILASLKDGLQVAPIVHLDLQIARRQLEAFSPHMSKPAQDASIQLEGGVIVPIPPELGYTINLEETLAILASDPQSVLLDGRLQVPLMPVLPQVTDVTPALAEAQRFMDTPVTIITYDPIQDVGQSFSVPRQAVGAWLAVEPGAQGPQVSINPTQVEAYLKQLSGELGEGRYLDAERSAPRVAEAVRQGQPALVQVHYLPTRYTVEPQDTMLKISWKLGMPYWKILQANPQVDSENLSAGTELVIPSRDELLPLPAIPNKRVVISLGDQRMRLIQDGKVIGQHVISTGIDRSPTQPGVFQVQSRDRNAYASVWDLYMPNFLGIYEAWPGFMNGLHGLPTLSNGQRLWENILGSPASYGCIILDLQTAEWLYDWAEDGVIVEIKP